VHACMLCFVLLYTLTSVGNKPRTDQTKFVRVLLTLNHHSLADFGLDTMATNMHFYFQFKISEAIMI
jgi:hypothetical protein